MTREQQNTLDLLTEVHGRVQVDVGYADNAIRVIAPNGTRWVVGEAGHARQAGISFSVNWNEGTDR